MRDIARLANVTPGTVSKVINNYPDISEATRQKVLKVIEENEYKPSSGSRTTLNYGTNPVIGFISEGVFNELYSEMEEIALTRFHNASYTILSYHDNYYTQDKEEKFEELLAYAKNNCLKGLIYVGGNFRDIPRESFEKLPCPTVFLNTALPTFFEKSVYSSILCNNYETGKYQMGRLIANGHKNIAIVISSKDDNSNYELRYKAYKDALEENQLASCVDNVVEGRYVYDKTYTATKTFLEEHPEITAIACSADIMAPAILRAAADLKKYAPKDFELISFDGLELLKYTMPSVTTFRQPKQEMMDAAYELLIGLMTGEKQHQHMTFQNELIIRESTR